ncbi:hypothetical protein AUEXF2481DRAFT_479711 [Aureobasidium subglaciale EXF-2481]|uniref:SET domain-containing protein n=1 Tax=Aureobasidium subglaciale (strain EXF-2481) TaxID=1043005 RepID=A0A074ZIE2_AURSE|nr:uncharacterized protein AUEXF2481DRAFT_479711 [Aureobasidium subglaciale EXF-2481]KEQ98326.1 hypothetical protein AUEXF2481DRAFT_479711 [Aureobasidium subglaciale EXF-2481]
MLIWFDPSGRRFRGVVTVQLYVDWNRRCPAAIARSRLSAYAGDQRVSCHGNRFDIHRVSLRAGSCDLSIVFSILSPVWGSSAIDHFTGIMMIRVRSAVAKIVLWQHVKSCSSFTRRVTTFAPKGRAPGLFATEDISVGALVACEKTHPYVHSFRSKFDISPNAVLVSRIIQMLFDSAPRLSNTDAPPKTSDLTWIDGAPIVDVFTLQGKMDYNAIVLTPHRPHEPYGDTPDIESGPDKTSITLLGHCQNIRHSCLENTQRSSIGDLLSLKATKDIMKGTEILTSFQPGE